MGFMTVWQRASQDLLDVILPPLCFDCSAPVDMVGALCSTCWQKLNFITPPCCVRCGVPFGVDYGADAVCNQCLETPPQFDRARAPLVYDEASRGFIVRFKHADQLHLARCFVPLLGMVAAELLARADFIMPVPLARWRLFKRRYNQAAIVAKLLAKQHNVPVVLHELQRIKPTRPQGGLKRKERLKNLKNVFALAGKVDVTGRIIILLDDVLTTGATANECARVLKNAGAARVDVLTIARVTLSDRAGLEK